MAWINRSLMRKVLASLVLAVLVILFSIGILLAGMGGALSNAAVIYTNVGLSNDAMKIGQHLWPALRGDAAGRQGLTVMYGNTNKDLRTLKAANLPPEVAARIQTFDQQWQQTGPQVQTVLKAADAGGQVFTLAPRVAAQGDALLAASQQLLTAVPVESGAARLLVAALPWRSQRLARQAAQIGLGQTEVAPALSQAAAEFDRALQALSNGDAQQVIAPLNGPAKDKLLALQGVWTPTYSDIQALTGAAELYGQGLQAAQAVQPAAIALDETSEAAQEAFFSAIINSVKGLLPVAAAGGLVSILMFVGVVWMIRRSLRPIADLTRTAQTLSGGDLQISVDIRREDEVGELARNFNETVAYLQNLADQANRLAEGDLTFALAPRSPQDVLGSAFAQMLAHLRQWIGETADNVQHVNASAERLLATSSEATQTAVLISAALRDIAEGVNQQTQSAVKANGSVGQLGAAIQRVAQGALEQAQSVSQAGAVMRELSEAVDGIRRGAIEQAQGMEGAAGARTRLSGALQDVAQAIELVSAGVEQAAGAAQSGTSLVAKTGEGIQRVRTATEQLAAQVRDLGKRSAQIGAVIETIDDISSQTNLLALNAAIEAARAGEHGKGFAVVAGEVRKLAERSTKATQEIAQMLHTVQLGAQETVEAMGRTGADVSAAVQLSGQTGVAFQEIAQAAQVSVAQMQTVRQAMQAMRETSAHLEKAVADAMAIAQRNQQTAEAIAQLDAQMVARLDSVGAVVEENTASTAEMAAGSTQVTQAIEAIARVSKANSEGLGEVNAAEGEMGAQIEDVSRSAQALSEMAQALQQVVAQFQLT